MGLIRFLGGIIGKKKIQKNKDSDLKEVSFDELKNQIEEKELELNIRERGIISSIKNLFSETLNELADKITILEEIDINSKKAETKLKLIVKENLIQYVSNIRELTKKLSNLQEKSLEELIEKYNRIFLDFDKRSYSNYEKATILIGREIAEVKEIIRKRYNSLKDIFEKNQNIIFSLNLISILKNSLKDTNKLEVFVSELNSKIELLNKKAKEIQEKNTKLLLKIEETKKSKNYLENLKKKKEIESLRKELEREIYLLKDKIDFKALGREFHTDGDKMESIRYCKENFLKCFGNETEFKKIINLISEAKLSNEEISKEITSLKNKKAEISKIENTLKKDPAEDLLSEIEKNNSEIEVVNIEKEKMLKNITRIEEKIITLKEGIAQESVKLGLSIKAN